MVITTQNEFNNKPVQLGPNCTVGSMGLVTVAATATLIAAANINRVSLIIQNQSAGAVFLGFSTSVNATTNYFVRLNQWDAYEINMTNNWKGPIYGIVAAGTSTVSYGEF